MKNFFFFFSMILFFFACKEKKESPNKQENLTEKKSAAEIQQFVEKAKEFGLTTIYSNGQFLVFKYKPASVEPDGTNEVYNPDTVTQWINDYQAAKDHTLKYVDLYLPSLFKYLGRIEAFQQQDKAHPIALRLYLIRKGEEESVALGPIKSIDEWDGKPGAVFNKVDVLWKKDTKKYPVLDYGSPCPDRCTILDTKKTKDLKGYQEYKP